jgi:hypothetical protein
VPRGLLAACAGVLVACFLGGGAYALWGDGTDAPEAADPAAPGVALSPDERALADRLSEQFGDCSPLERAPGQVAKLNCDTTPEGIATLHAVQWADSATMADAFRESYVARGKYDRAPCGEFPGGPGSEGTGRISTWPGVGAIACYVNVNSDAVLLWQVDSEAVQLLAIREDPESRELFRWWQQSRDGVLRTGG